MIRNLLIPVNVRRFFEGESDNTGNQNPATTTGAGAQNPNPNPANPNPATPKTYTEQQFNELLNRKVAEDRRKTEERTKQLVQELNTLRESTNLTQQQKEDLQRRTEELESTYRTAEEQKKMEIGRLEEKFNTETTKLKKDRDTWETRHNDLLTSVDINRAAQKYGAFDPDQIEAILRPWTKVTETNGVYTPKVKFPALDREGKPVVLDLTIAEAVKAMVEWPDKYGNLFKSTANKGLGSGTNGSSNGNIRLDLESMSPQQYKENREKVHAQLRAS